MTEAALKLVQYKGSFPTFAEEVLWIRTKGPEGLIRFKLKRFQRFIWDNIILPLLIANKPIRIFVLKGRQMGISTMMEGIGYWMTSLWPHREGLVVAHEDDAARKIFTMMDVYYSHSPPWLRPLRRISNTRELRFDNPNRNGEPGLGSGVTVATAKNKNFGVGSTLQFVHLSEFARFEEVNPDVRDSYRFMKQAVADAPMTFLVIETTAKGDNYAKEIWDNKDNDFVKLFLSWVADPDYLLDDYQSEGITSQESFQTRDEDRFGNEEDAARHMKKELAFWYPENNAEWHAEELLRRMAWRRMKIRADFDFDIAKFRQEYPLYPEEAFILSGSNVFDTVKVAALHAALEDGQGAPAIHKRFNLANGLFDSAVRDGDLRIYRLPEPDVRYALGADTGEGYDDSDYSSCQVLSLPDFEQVAVANLLIDPDDWARYLKALATFYNRGHIAVEVPGPGATTLNQLLKHEHYFRLYRRRAFDTATGTYTKRYGFSTNRATKGMMIDELRGLFRDDTLLLNDIDTLNEMSSFMRIRRPNHAHEQLGASNGKHDDRVMALALAVQMAIQMGGLRRERGPQNPPDEVQYGTLDWWLKKMDKTNARDKFGDNDLW